MPKISIVVPVYNVQKYIGQCLESLVNQTFKDIEIIIVDDGSPDESYKIYEEYANKDSRIKIIKKVNAGVSEARNTGIENAAGDFIIFVDSDDWMELNGCEVLYNEYLKSKADLVLSDAYTVTNGKKHQNRVFDEAFVTEDKDFIKQYEMACIGYGYNPRPAVKWNISGLGSPWNKLYNRKIIMENGLRFDPYVKGIYDDNLFALHYLAKIKKISYVPVPVYDYRIVSQSLTQSYKANTLEISSRIFEKIKEFIDEEGDWESFSKPFHNYVIRRFSAELGVYYFSSNSNKSLGDTFAELKKMMNQEPYKSAIAAVDTSRLLKAHSVTCKIARTNSPFLMWLMFKSRRIVKKFM